MTVISWTAPWAEIDTLAVAVSLPPIFGAPIKIVSVVAYPEPPLCTILTPVIVPVVYDIVLSSCLTCVSTPKSILGTFNVKPAPVVGTGPPAVAAITSKIPVVASVTKNVFAPCVIKSPRAGWLAPIVNDKFEYVNL